MWQVGLRLGRGEPLEEILGSTSEVAEGVATARAVRKLIETKVRHVDAPSSSSRSIYACMHPH